MDSRSVAGVMLEKAGWEEGAGYIIDFSIWLGKKHPKRICGWGVPDARVLSGVSFWRSEKNPFTNYNTWLGE
jgi:hypothetical protein